MSSARERAAHGPPRLGPQRPSRLFCEAEEAGRARGSTLVLFSCSSARVPTVLTYPPNKFASAEVRSRTCVYWIVRVRGVRRRRRPGGGGGVGGVGSARAAPGPPGRAPRGPPGRQTAKNRSQDNIFRKWRTARIVGYAHCARRAPLLENVGFEPVLGLVPRNLGLLGSVGLGGVLLVHFCRGQVQKPPPPGRRRRLTRSPGATKALLFFYFFRTPPTDAK